MADDRPSARLSLVVLILVSFLIIPVAAGAAPVANFTATPTTGPVPFTVSFTDQSTGSPTGWAWFFGDETYNTPWVRVNASSGWRAREQHSSIVMPDGSILLMGGIYNVSNNLGLNDTWRSTDNGTTWMQVNASSGWPVRWGHGSLAMRDGSIVLMGGGGEDGWKNDTWRSADSGVTWTRVNASSGWSARSYFTSVALTDGSIVLMGGWDSTGYKNDTWRSTDNGAMWTLVNASSGWGARQAHSSVVMPDGGIVLMGGRENSGLYKNDTWRSADNGATWTQVNASSGWSVRWLHTSAAMPDNSIVLTGGASGGGLKNGTWRSTDKGATWTPLLSPGWSARESPGFVGMPDGSITLTGGIDSSGPKNDTWRFQPAGSSLQNPSHAYTTPGNYTVTLQAYNNGGYNRTVKTGYINVTSGSASAISGTVYYPGAKTGTIYIEAFEPIVNGSMNSLGTTTIPSPGPYTLAVPNGSCWIFAYLDEGDKGYPSRTDPSGSPINRSIEYRPDTIQVNGSVTGIDITLFEIARTYNATLQIANTSIVHYNNDSLTHGTYPVVNSRGLNIIGGNDGVFIADTMKVSVTGSHIIDADYHSVWNNTHVQWTYPDRYAIQPINSFDVGWWDLDTPGTSDIPITLNRRVNRSVFTAPGYQQVSFNATFENATCSWIYGRITLGGNGTEPINRSIMTGTFQTDAPLINLHPVNDQILGYSLNQSEIVEGRVYNFSVVIFVDPSLAHGVPMRFKPSVSMAQGFTTNYRGETGGNTTAVIPVDLLPPYVTSTTLTQNFLANWSYASVDVKRMGLDAVIRSEAAPSANFTANATYGTVPLAVQFTDTSTGSPSAYNWSFGDGNISSLQNPVFTYTIPGNYTVALNITTVAGYNTTVKSQFIRVSPLTGNYTLILRSGWNFVATPRKLRAGNDTTQIFKDVNTVGHSIWQYDAQVKQWKAMNATVKVNPLDGVWIYSNRTIDIPLWFSQDPIATPPTKPVYAGWNAIGYSDITPLSARSTLVSVNPGWSLMIGYDAGAQAYEVSIINGGSGSHSDSLEMLPTKGYWLYMMNNGELAAVSA